jgi:ectoine hydroxylase-related dioxygenase (phytanoyl-CoA dioxygenase family)
VSAISTVNTQDDYWLSAAMEAIGPEGPGVIVVEEVLSAADVSVGQQELEAAFSAMRGEVGDAKLQVAGEHGVARIPMGYRPWFFGLFAIDHVLAVVEETLGDTAICHLQNGFLQRPNLGNPKEGIFQEIPHRDFPRYLNGYVASVNTLFALSEFSEKRGATRVLPGSHQSDQAPNREEFLLKSVPVECRPGSMVVFDSTLWHSAGKNCSEDSRYAINNQWTKSFIKQQIDYVRALGDEVLADLPDRTQQLLGWYTRVVTSVDEFYRPPSERLYRSGQG